MGNIKAEVRAVIEIDGLDGDREFILRPIQALWDIEEGDIVVLNMHSRKQYTGIFREFSEDDDDVRISPIKKEGQMSWSIGVRIAGIESVWLEEKQPNAK